MYDNAMKSVNLTPNGILILFIISAFWRQADRVHFTVLLGEPSISIISCTAELFCNIARVYLYLALAIQHIYKLGAPKLVVY